MSGKPWFRRKAIGYGFTPISWEGWLVTLGLLLVVLATMALLGDPPADEPRVAAWATGWRGRLGLSGVHLPYFVRLVLVIAEGIAFWALVRSRMRRDPPLG
jgi:hypothetical protein